MRLAWQGGCRRLHLLVMILDTLTAVTRKQLLLPLITLKSVPVQTVLLAGIHSFVCTRVKGSRDRMGVVFMHSSQEGSKFGSFHCTKG